MRTLRTVVGYHGCLESFATEILKGTIGMKEWKPSEEASDWLGSGIYFWEHGPRRAAQWAQNKGKRLAGKPGVIGAHILLDDVLDLADPQYMELLKNTHADLSKEYAAAGKNLPKNTGKDSQLKNRQLDRFVINTCLARLEQQGVRFSAVRGIFQEGPPCFSGSKILEGSHVQIAVRDPTIIYGVFRPIP